MSAAPELDYRRFRFPDWDDDLDAEARIRQLPETAMTRGLYFRSLYGLAEKRNTPIESPVDYSAVKMYPTTEYMRLVVQVCETAWGGVNLRRAIREIGRTIYPTFADSFAGKALMTMAGSNFGTAMKLAGKAYDITARPIKVSTEFPEDGVCIVHMKNTWAFPDAFHVGVWEGALTAFGQGAGTVQVDLVGESSADFLVRW